MDTVLEKVFSYEGIPEIILDFIHLEERFENGSLGLQEKIEKKYRENEESETEKVTYLNDIPYSFRGEPAIIQKNHIDGEDGSMFEDESIREEWHRRGKIDRERDEPAIVVTTSFRVIQYWYIDGKLGREKDLPAKIERELETVENPGIYLTWYKNGRIHRDGDKPAIISPFHQVWIQNGLMHREGNPAVIYKAGKTEWYLNGRVVSGR